MAWEELLPKRRWATILMGAACLLSISGGRPAWKSGPYLPDSSLSLLHRVFAECPPIEGRLTGDLQGLPGKVPTFQVRSESVLPASEAVRHFRGAAQIEQRAADAPYSGELHALGLLHLAQGHLDEAILTLETVSARDPGN